MISYWYLIDLCKMLEEEQNLLTELQYNLNKFYLWLDEASSVAGIPVEPGNEYQLKDTLQKVKLRVEELPPHKGILKRLTEAGGKALGSASLSPEVKHKLDTRLKEANHRWIKKYGWTF
nr:dystrophin-like isoform X2 [Zootoca vivipara]